MRHLLVIDDDSRFRAQLVDYLSQYAFRVTGARDCHQAEQIIARDRVDLTLLDLNLRQEDGLDVVRKLSGRCEAPIIAMSSDRLEEADKVAAFELGVSDYVTKPCGLRELVARVRAVLRVRPVPAEQKDLRKYSFGRWALNVKMRQLTYDGERQVKLTACEYSLLLAFLKAPRQVLSRQQLLSASRVNADEVFDRCIDVLVLRLRRKLERNSSDPKLIRTERGIGYVFDTNVAIETRRSMANYN